MAHLYTLAVLCVIVAVSEWLVRRTRLRAVGAALLIIVFTALVANLGALPSGSTERAMVPVYESILAYVAPLSIFWLLLSARLRDLVDTVGPLIVLFVVGVMATAGGVMLAMWALDGAAAIGPLYDTVGGMLIATFTGESANLEVVASGRELHGEVLHGATLTTGYVVTAFWMVVTLALPRLLLPVWPRKAFLALRSGMRPINVGVRSNTEAVHPMHLALVLAMGFGAVWLADGAAFWLAAWGVPVPAIVILVVLALVVGQLPMVARLQGARLLGLLGVYLFLAVLGAFCDVTALIELGPLGVTLMLVALIVVAVHGVVSFVTARLMKADLVLAAVASQANIGGGTSALALASSLGRSDLVLPAVLVGTLGSAVGTYVGLWTAAQVLPLLAG